MKSSVLTLLAERLRQREMRSALNRSKRITTATREASKPILDALCEESKRTGIDCDKILAAYVEGKGQFPAIDAALARHRKPATPTITAASTRPIDIPSESVKQATERIRKAGPPPQPPTQQKPKSEQTSHIDELAKLSGAEATAYYRAHTAEIDAERRAAARAAHEKRRR